MLVDVTAAQVIAPLTLEVHFADGVFGRVRLLPSHLRGVFEALVDPRVFGQVRVIEGFVSWPGEIDLAPDAMYAAIARDGEWVLG